MYVLNAETALHTAVKFCMETRVVPV